MSQFKVFHSIEPRGKLYFDKYQWVVNWKQTEVQVLRYGLDAASIEKSIANSRYYEHRRSIVYNQGNVKSKITKQVVQNCHRLATLLSNAPEYKRVFTINTAMIYGNCTEFRTNLVDFVSGISDAYVKQADVIYQRNAVVLKNPCHKYRTYLKSQRIPESSRDNLKLWLNQQSNEVKASPALTQFLYPASTSVRQAWTFDHFFLDHNDLSTVTMIALIWPESIRKTVSLVAK